MKSTAETGRNRHVDLRSKPAVYVLHVVLDIGDLSGCGGTGPLHTGKVKKPTIAVGPMQFVMGQNLMSNMLGQLGFAY